MHVRNLAKKYGIQDPLILLNSEPMSKSNFKEMIKTKIIVYNERELRTRASTISQMNYLNVSVSGLNGKCHPALSNIMTAQEVKQMRPHIKMLAGDYLTYAVQAAQSDCSPHCRLCLSPIEDIMHVVACCDATAVSRHKLLFELSVVTSFTVNKIDFSEITKNPNTLTQYILDCTSLNLNNKYRVNVQDNAVYAVFKKSREFIFKIHTERIQKLKEIKKKEKTK